MIKYCQQIVEQTKQIIKQNLTEIRKLDELVQLYQYSISKTMRELYEELKKSDKDKEKCQQYQITILQIQQQINRLSQKKIKIAECMYFTAGDARDIIEEQFRNCSEEKKKEEEKELMKDQWDDRNMKAQIKTVEAQSYCICFLNEKRTINLPEMMIKCQGKSCPYVWFHLDCVQIESDKVPEHWKCDACRLRQLE